MQKEIKSVVKSHWQLFLLTGNPVFASLSLYEKRTNNIVTLAPLEQTDQLNL